GGAASLGPGPEEAVRIRTRYPVLSCHDRRSNGSNATRALDEARSRGRSRLSWSWRAYVTSPAPARERRRLPRRTFGMVHRYFQDGGDGPYELLDAHGLLDVGSPAADLGRRICLIEPCDRDDGDRAVLVPPRRAQPREERCAILAGQREICDDKVQLCRADDFFGLRDIVGVEDCCTARPEDLAQELAAVEVVLDEEHHKA